MKLLLLSAEDLDLATREAERLHGIMHGAMATRRLGNLLLLDTQRISPTLAFTREAASVIAEMSNENIAAGFANIAWERVATPPFCVRAHTMHTAAEHKSSLNEKEAAAIVWRALERAGIAPAVSLSSPKTEINIYFEQHTAFVTTLDWRNTQRFSQRRAHLRPRNHPSSLSPKLARAMVNLAGEERSVHRILDPFCGAGGILIEGALAGREMIGTDIDAQQIARAEENLVAAGMRAMLSVGDATQCDQLGAFDAIVTDLPLGKSTKLGDAQAVFFAFFAAAARSSPTMVVAADAAFPLEKCFTPQWRAAAHFDWYIHCSMTKRIWILERS